MPRLFAPQKGASPVEVEQLEDGAHHFASLVGEELAMLPRTGAAGGVGFGLRGLAGGRLIGGVEWLLDAVEFEARAEGSDLVVTGEGRVDGQTLLGKVPGGLFEVATRMGIPTVVVGGSVVMSSELASSGFAEIVAATPEGMPLEEAMRPEVARENLRLAGVAIGKKLLQ